MSAPEHMCANCGWYEGTIKWVCEGGALDFVHGFYSWWCEGCALRAQIVRFEERRREIEDVRARLTEWVRLHRLLAEETWRRWDELWDTEAENPPSPISEPSFRTSAEYDAWKADCAVLRPPTPEGGET